ncbi:hypothetical protein IWW51_002903 [Coemansia sp. RSA 2702]|nr:hypothetical protein IWW51_002903 [Coemansia sp. RSA 2702]
MGSTDFSKYTHINVAFSIPNEDGTFSFEDDWALPQITRQARSGGAQVLMSVGGWTGSNHFSNILKSESKRQTLLNSMRDYLKKNELDGIDIDWEYPGRQGNTCNAVDAGQDTPNFLAFLKDLRQLFTGEFGERKKLITLAVRVQPFDINGSPTSDVSEFAQYVDYVNIMAYDINGPWNPDTGPNAPFNYEESKGTPLSFVSGINAWLDAGMPANKLVAGLGFYGRSTIAQQDMQRVPSQYQPQLHDVPLGDPEDAPWYDKCAGTTSASGTWQWKHLRTQGILTDFTTAAAPWVRQWDKVSQTPWLFHPEKKLFLSYDDPESIRIKSDYAASKGLAGVMLWSINMDHNSELIDAASSFGRSGNNSSVPESSHSASSPLASSSSASTAPPASSTSSSSSISATHSFSPAPKPTGNEVAPGAPCSELNKYRCVDANGHNAAYLVCIGGKQVAASCATGTVCLSFQSTIICGWPSLTKLVEGVDSLFHSQH